MIDIRHSFKNIIDNDFYLNAHQYAALDFELKKHAGEGFKGGTRLAGMHEEYQKLDKFMKEKGAMISQLPCQNPFMIAYKLTYEGKDYLLDSELIVKNIRLLSP